MSLILWLIVLGTSMSCTGIAIAMQYRKSTKKDKPSRAERGYSDARGPKKKDDWQEFFKDKEPDFSEEGWARRKPKKK